MDLRLHEISKLVKGELYGTDKGINNVSIDTRTLSEHALYVAIKGDRFDGHDFIEQAEKAGAAALLLSQKVVSKLPQIVVTDTRIALAELAAAIRDKAEVKVCAITGSNGKTTVKEMVSAILAVNASVLSTSGNLNNDIGVPLTLLRLKGENEFAVIEMGANHADEIAYSCHYAKPDVALITNAAAVHIEGFGCIDGVASAKAEIIESLSDNGVAILNADDDYFNLWRAIAWQRNCLSFGLNNIADVRAENISSAIKNEQFISTFDLLINQQKTSINLALAGEHNVKNALAASAACTALGVGIEQIKQGLEQFNAVKGRMQLKVSTEGYQVINDSYNANPASLQVALDAMKETEKEFWLALGEFGELGAASSQLHTEMGLQIKQAGVQRLFAIGDLTKNTVAAFGDKASHYATQEDLISAVEDEINSNVMLLVKGSRSQKMEVVVDSLISKVRN
ncbi:MAG: UDP-N-acetylmuramoyl-tripeptide--D-alanyl-D-alanine ligase [Methyloprofundus sp.]|nr:UDP-N-acetylmuramoyl-tripeptide--D-alanyl-D-alanine ligase [Methyloprofundus sp.]